MLSSTNVLSFFKFSLLCTNKTTSLLLPLSMFQSQFLLLYFIKTTCFHTVASLGRFIQQKLSCPSISEYEKLQAQFSDLQIKYNDLLAAHHKTCKEVPFTFSFSGNFIIIFSWSVCSFAKYSPVIVSLQHLTKCNYIVLCG